MTHRDFLRIQTRRDFFRLCAGGIETAALAHLLNQEGRASVVADPLAPR